MGGNQLLPPVEWFVLARATTLHALHLRTALALAGEGADAASLVGRPAAALRSLGFPPAAAQWVSSPDAAQVETDRAWAAAERVRLLTLDDPASYPARLKPLNDAPVVLWVRGDPAAVDAAQVAVVGSRYPTAGGLRHARRFGRHLAQAGLAVTSGLARGIDAAAHEGALEGGGRTVAVCGTGLDTTYPRRNAPLAARIAADGGAVVSEFPPRTEPRADHFPRRNRIISGLALGVLVVEAARDSGSLITARLALDQGRDLMAVPGSIDSPVSAGCHGLIRSGGAALVQNLSDILETLAGSQKFFAHNQEVTASDEGPVAVRRLDKPQEMLLDALGFEPASIDDLIARTGHSAQDIAVRLNLLALEGLVESLPGGRYGRLPHSRHSESELT